MNRDAGERERLANKTSQTLSQRVIPAFQRAPFLPFSFLLLYVARTANDSLICTQKNQCNNVLRDIRQGWLPTIFGRSFHFDLLPHRRLPDASFGTTLFRSRLYLSSSAQMTTIHPIPVSPLLHHSCLALPTFRGSAGSFSAFFYP